MTALQERDITRIREKRAEEISPRFLEKLETGYYEDDDNGEIPIVAKGKIPAAKGIQPAVISSGNYRIISIPLHGNTSAARSDSFSFSGLGPTQQMLCISYPLDFVDKAIPAAFPALLWLNEALDFEKAGRRDRAIDIIFAEIDKLLRKGDFEVCNQLLEILNPQQLSPNLSVAFLTITLQASEWLPSRGVFYSRVEEHFKNLPNKSKLLSGLKSPPLDGPRFY